jgi:hypothetical protein
VSRVRSLRLVAGGVGDYCIERFVPLGAKHGWSAAKFAGELVRRYKLSVVDAPLVDATLQASSHQRAASEL